MVEAERLLADWPALKRQWERYLAGEAQRAPSRPTRVERAALDYTEARTRYKAAQAALERTAEATALNTASQALAGAREALLAAGVGESESVKVEMKKSGGNVSWKDWPPRSRKMPTSTSPATANATARSRNHSPSRISDSAARKRYPGQAERPTS